MLLHKSITNASYFRNFSSNREGGFWKDVENQRVLFDRVSKSLGIKDKEDWYHVNYENTRKHLRSVLKYYNSSLRNLKNIAN